jgi:PPM family protein phosphatase
MTVSGVSHIGHVRKANEDAMVWDTDLGFAAVADGMGGHQAGEVAAQLALETVHVFLQKSATTSDFTWPFGINPGQSLNANRLMTAFKIANRRVFKRSEEMSDYVMGTTLVAVLIDRDRVTYASVGDSRIYVLTGAALRPLTVDDSWRVVLAKEPGLTEEALRTHPMRNVLTKVIGAKPDLELEVQDLVWNGEALLLSSDGLHNALTPEAMAQIICSRPGTSEAADVLVRAALDRDGKDNITAVIVRPRSDVVPSGE